MDKKDKYTPVKHTSGDDKKMFSNPKVKAAYDALDDEYAALDALLKARHEAGLTQKEVAARMVMKPPSLARIETSLGSHKHSPSLVTLRKYAAACGKKLVIKFT